MEAILNSIGFASGSVASAAVMLLVFGSVVLAVLGVGTALSGGRSLRRRMNAAGEPEDRLAAVAATGSVRFADDVVNVGPVLRLFTKKLVPTSMAELSAVHRRLIQAGYIQPSAVGFYYVIRLLLAVGLGGGFLLVAPFISGEMQTTWVLAVNICLAGLGYYLPSAWIAMRTASLQRQYRESFPDALDLLVVCVEAGLALDAGISRVGQELSIAHPALAENFRIMSLELRAGKSRADALRNLADRLGIDEVKVMVTLLLQSEELGTSIADALRVYSDEMRVKRMLRAETKAQSLPVKLALPLGLFVFPVMMIVVLLPAVIRIRNSLLPVDFG